MKKIAYNWEMELRADQWWKEKCSWGVPGLDVEFQIWSRDDAVLITTDEMDYSFSPHGLPRVGTEIIRRHNLNPLNLRWMFWVRDTPDLVYEWRPEWNAQKKCHQPLTKSRCPQRMAPHRIPAWVQAWITRQKSNA